MMTALLTLAFIAAGYALLLSLAVTAVIVVSVIKFRKNGSFGKSEKAEVPADERNEEISVQELIRINYEIARDLERSDKRSAELLAKYEQSIVKLNALSEMAENIRENNKKMSELALKLTEEREINKKLAQRLRELEAERSKSPDGAASGKIRELEELVNYKDEYYAEILNSEKKLRAGVCGAIDSLIRTRGSDSTEYLEEQIEEVIRLLDASRTKSK